MIRAVIFDWGDTLMRDFPEMAGAMATWPVVAVVEGVPEALGRLDDQLICCVASNAGSSDAHLMALALERGSIRHHFDHLFTSKELGAAKPDIRFFQAVAERIGLRPEECVMVGNDYAKDVAGAKQAGMQTVWLAVGVVDPGREHEGLGPGLMADHIITSMTELPHLLLRLRGTARP